MFPSVVPHGLPTVQPAPMMSGQKGVAPFAVATPGQSVHPEVDNISGTAIVSCGENLVIVLVRQLPIY